ncbi:membrane protein required for colicin V production [Tangfeifania diversioriginum]|uniref:Membrane protein required for colicin V production n=1 Tax=Tangfeifania diversioriginum TaxID=1168035 RepID=A0A1M6F5R1_9BACT|nr:CvpA family protein [Tangfeifania diversioriginum]SHI93010.1 membrane protein required for colicin V production [Tangfeifania diversioriginum]
MNYIDIILGLLLLFAAISGFRKGLVAELASLAALILGIWGAIEFSYITTDFLTENFNFETEYLNIISFIITFIVIVILVHIVGSAVNKFIEAAMLGFINKLAGLAFGILRSALILSIILIVLEKIDEDVEILSQEAKAKSQLYEPVRNFAPALFPFINIWDDSDEPGKKDENIFESVKKAVNG